MNADEPSAAEPQPNCRTDLWSVATDQRSVLRTCAHGAQMFTHKDSTQSVFICVHLWFPCSGVVPLLRVRHAGGKPENVRFLDRWASFLDPPYETF